MLPKWSWTDGIPIIVWFWPTLDMSDHIPFATKNTTQLIGNMVWGFKGCKWIQCSQEDLQSREACDMNLSPCIIPDIMFESSLKILHFSDLTRAYLAALQIGLYMFLHVGSGRAIKTKKMLEVFKKQACADDWIQVWPCVFYKALRYHYQSGFSPFVYKGAVVTTLDPTSFNWIFFTFISVRNRELCRRLSTTPGRKK